MCQSEVYPECIIDYTQDETDAYLTFNDEFVRRPLGSDGARAAHNWMTAKPIKCDNKCFGKLILANNLFDADLKLKQLILGKKRIRKRFELIFWLCRIGLIWFNQGWCSGTFYITKFYLYQILLIMKKGKTVSKLKRRNLDSFHLKKMEIRGMLRSFGQRNSVIILKIDVKT